jgi:hypothetical protein|tara:strand:+ start:380 stop:964 length:585 start_codon:yes stop_codon:yes gene_type:complete
MILARIKYVYKIISLSAVIFLNMTGHAMAYEEPDYKLIKTTDVYEIRQYEDRLAVQTTQAIGQNGAFRRLFKYISGSNQSSSKIEMTVPVIQSDGSGSSVMLFFLPTSFTKQSAPLPKADNVELVTIKGGYYAVINYSGRSTNKNFKKHATILKDALNADNIVRTANPSMATYNGPFTPFFLRRNEAMYRVQWK